ncbi:MAG: hypothetical protein KUG75_06700, partial [Pseudomonadales bacterium]|nr:hypothetical protein [Pseudomonadales bacterium]
MNKSKRLRIGLVVNPHAGLGGPLALHGSDALVVTGAFMAGTDIEDEFVAPANKRVLPFLERLKDFWSGIDFYCWGGVMGELAFV